MMGHDPTLSWPLVYAFVLVVLSLWVAYSVSRLSESMVTAPVDDHPGTSPRDADAAVIQCRNCGTENDPGYRYCRGCVEELPASPGRTRSNGVPNRRGIF